jgi:hypothetical protein
VFFRSKRLADIYQPLSLKTARVSLLVCSQALVLERVNYGNKVFIRDFAHSSGEFGIIHGGEKIGS